MKIASTIILYILFNISINAQTTVNSLQALLPYLSTNNINVKLAPGIYTIDTDNYTDFVVDESILLFSGNNSTYDFTDVTINFDTEIHRNLGNVTTINVRIIGNNNTLLNMKMVDIGDERPSRSANDIVMDGEDNTIEGFDMTVQGSFPYGYGDAFGKGAGYVIKHYKRCALLIRGTRNHIKDINILHRSYGHAVFMQGAVEALIESVHIEGEVRTTDDILAEEGTGSPADLEDFMTIWGHSLPPGYMLSLGEDGIRAYNSGTTLINGVEVTRNTTDITIRDSYVKNMRSGVSLSLGYGSKNVENTTTIGCEAGFLTSSGVTIENCNSDAIYGPAYRNVYGRGGIEANIELLPASAPYYNGSKAIAYLGGPNNITFTGAVADAPADHQIQLGGALDDVRLIEGYADYQHNHDVTNATFYNYTEFPILIFSQSSNNDVYTCSAWTDNGTNNTISELTDCIFVPCGNFDAFSIIEAEDYCDMDGIQSENSIENGDNIGWIENSDYIAFSGVNFGDQTANYFEARVACNFTGGNIEIRKGSPTGELLGSIPVENTGGNQAWVTLGGEIEETTGVWDIYLVFTGGEGYLFNINYFNFSYIIPCLTSWTDADFTVSNETVNYNSNTINIACLEEACISLSLEGIGNMEDDDYINVYYSVDGGATQTLSENINAFSENTLTICGITGNSLEITIQAATSYPGEIYAISGLSVYEAESCTDIQLHANLEGAYDATSGEMSTTLNTRGLLPGKTPLSNLVTPTPAGQPYSAAPWNYAGTEGADWTDANYTGDETDWVLVSFRTGTAKNTEVAMTAALLMKDGSITSPNRCALIPDVASPLYIVVEHRNHIGVMTPQPVDVIDNTLTYDFRSSDSYRDPTSFGQKQLSTGEWTMYAGDADQSDFPSFDIKGTDKTIWFDNNGVFDYYFLPDFNLDGDINGQDKSLWFDNNGISSRVPK